MKAVRLAMVLLVLCCVPMAALAADVVKVGGLFDLTGATAEVGKPFLEGARDAVAWVNENGGINGKKLEMITVDYGYKTPEAVAAYKKFVGEKVIMIQGWGSGDTEALKDQVTKDKIPYFSAGFTAHMNDPAKTPYNFFVGASYSDQVRAFLQFVKKDFKDKTRKPKVCFIYPNNGFGKSPIEAGKLYAKELGIQVVDDQVTPPAGFQDATSQLLNMQKQGADYAFIQNTVKWAAMILKDSKKLGIKTKFFLNNYGMTEQLPELAKDAAEGVYGMVTTAPFDSNVPGMKKVKAYHQKNHPKDAHNVFYVRGWTYVLTWSEGLKIADKKKQLNGEGVKQAMESLRNYDLGGLVQPVTFTPSDHRSSTKSEVYVIKGGKLAKVGEYEVPRKKEWLGL